MFQNDDNESTTETINYIIKKFSDTYLLPAITATLIALIYFAYKWGRTNLGYKPLTILNLLYVGDDTKRESATSNILIVPNNAVNELQPMTVSAASFTQLRNKSLSNKMLSLKNKIFDKEIAKLHSNSLIRNLNIFAYPIYDVWDEDLSNLMEPMWDYNDMTYPPRDFPFSKTNLSYKIRKGYFYYQPSNNDTVDAQNILNTDMCVFDINERSVKNKNTSGTFSRDKQERVPFKEYYHICYDSEGSSEDSYDYPGEIFENQINSKTTCKQVLETSRSGDNSKLLNKTIFDETEFVSVDLKSCNYSKEPSKTELSGISVENDIMKGQSFEDYWKIV